MATDTPDPIRVLLVDDHQMVRQGLRFFLSTQPGFEIVGEAENGEDAVRLVEELAPDVVLMDLILPGTDELEATRQILSRSPEVEILILTSYVDDQKELSALRCGASGYLMKDVAPQELARAIHAAVRGEVYLQVEAARRLAHACVLIPSIQAKHHLNCSQSANLRSWRCFFARLRLAFSWTDHPTSIPGWRRSRKRLVELRHGYWSVLGQATIKSVAVLVAKVEPLHPEGGQLFARLPAARHVEEIPDRILGTVRVSPI